MALLVVMLVRSCGGIVVVGGGGIVGAVVIRCRLGTEALLSWLGRQGCFLLLSFLQ